MLTNIGPQAASLHRPQAINMEPDIAHAAHANFQQCFDACENIVRAHQPSLPRELPPALVNRLNGNVATLIRHGYDTPERIQQFADQCLHHDMGIKVAQSTAVDVPGNVANFIGMHNPALLGADTANGTLTAIGLHVGVVLGVVDALSGSIVDSAVKHLAYHASDPHAIEKTMDPEFRPNAMDQTMSKVWQGALKNVTKNALRIPAIALSSSAGLVNTNNTPVIKDGVQVVQRGSAGVVDNAIDSFAPFLVKPLMGCLLERPLAPGYKTSLFLSPNLEDTIQRAQSSWGQAIKNGAKNTILGVGAGAKNLLRPASSLAPAFSTIALTAHFVASAFNTNTNINESGRREWDNANVRGTWPIPSLNGTAASRWPAANEAGLMPGIVPEDAYMKSRGNSLATFGTLSLVAPLVAQATQWIADKAINAAFNAWAKDNTPQPRATHGAAAHAGLDAAELESFHTVEDRDDRAAAGLRRAPSNASLSSEGSDAALSHRTSAL